MYIWRLRCVGYDEAFQRELPAKIDEWDSIKDAKEQERDQQPPDEPRSSHKSRKSSKKTKAAHEEKPSQPEAENESGRAPGKLGMDRSGTDDGYASGVDKRKDAAVVDVLQFRHSVAKSQSTVQAY